jgi:hypothetical protein
VFGSGVLLYLKNAALWPAWPSSRKSFTNVNPLTICSPSKKVTLTNVLPCQHSTGDTASMTQQQQKDYIEGFWHTKSGQQPEYLALHSVWQC